MDNAAANEMMTELRDYYDTLDAAYRNVDAMGGADCPKGKDSALEALLSSIWHMGGRDVYARKREGYPFFAKPNMGDDAGPYFRAYALAAGHTLTVQDVADIQAVLCEHNDLIGEQSEQHHNGYIQALRDIGGDELVHLHETQQSNRVDEVVRKVLDAHKAKRKELS